MGHKANHLSLVHFVAQFLPWHRYFVHIYEKALRDCGYSKHMPYWDWTQDAGALPSSQVVEAFGGNGAGGGWSSPSRPNPLTSCVTSGPLADMTLTYYDGTERKHCLNRQLNNGTGSENEALWGSKFYNPDYIENLMDSSEDFVTFWEVLENEPHGAIHNAIGGDMVPSTSPNDPLFFLHHAQVDRLWWLWQQQDPSARDTDFGGKRIDGSDATLDDEMPFMELGSEKAVTIRGMMTTNDGMLCYTYV
jgi:tyrosinase